MMAIEAKAECRVVRPGGVAWLVELDPEASAAQVRRHADRLDGRWLARAFGPLVVATAPPVTTITALARAAGWRDITVERDPEQPVYLVRLA